MAVLLILNWRSRFSLFSIAITIILGLSIKRIFNFWIILEINIIFFLLFLITEERIKVMIKYFLIQSFRSSIILWSFFLSSIKRSTFIELLFLLRFLIKLGAAPFHSWIINILKRMGWLSILRFASLQKIIPIYGVFCFNLQHYKLIIIRFCLLMSVYGIFNTNLIKVLIGYSSIFSLAWILSRENFYFVMLYLIFYFLNLLALSSFLEFSNNNLISDIKDESRRIKKFGVILRFLRMAGIPPLTGFLGKIYIIWELIFNSNFLLLLILLASSLFVLFLYLRLRLLVLSLTSSYFILVNSTFSKLEQITLRLLLFPIFFLLLSVLHRKIWFF